MSVLISFTSVLTGVRGLLQATPSNVLNELMSFTPVEVAAVGGGGVLSVGVVRWLVKRRAASGAGGQAVTSVSTTASGSSGRTKHKVAFTLPRLLPLSKGIREVTHLEIHAIELGLVVGLALTWLYDAGHTKPVVGILVAFVVGSLGYKRYASKGFKTLRLEPWYALLALAGGAALGWAIFMQEVRLLTQLGV